VHEVVAWAIGEWDRALGALVVVVVVLLGCGCG